ncbi:MAG: hypothetical protein JWQ44_1280 [Chthoniobacter sp.]|jgi:hypothetical protein|nr:hypothetical protein [Chthoniobacter sp.]
MRLLLAIGILVLGVLVVCACVRDYIHDTRNAIADDMWDYLQGRMLSIMVGAVMIVVGGCMVLLALNPGSSLSFSSEFPFVLVQRPTGGRP